PDFCNKVPKNADKLMIGRANVRDFEGDGRVCLVRKDLLCKTKAAPLTTLARGLLQVRQLLT
ncbi:MAG: hypothetical protein ACKPKO_45930, partial [Candidatus Fonsibacter sp.]